MQLSVTVTATFDECYFGVYDYINDDIDHTCASSAYALSDVYTYSFSDKSGEGWYGINTCDSEEETELPTDETEITEETTDETTTDETTTEEAVL